jgi:flagellar basal body-associated protein FliL
MNTAPLIITLLIVTAILVQAAAFFVTFWIRRKINKKQPDDNETVGA